MVFLAADLQEELFRSLRCCVSAIKLARNANCLEKTKPNSASGIAVTLNDSCLSCTTSWDGPAVGAWVGV